MKAHLELRRKTKEWEHENEDKDAIPDHGKAAKNTGEWDQGKGTGHRQEEWHKLSSSRWGKRMNAGRFTHLITGNVKFQPVAFVFLWSRKRGYILRPGRQREKGRKIRGLKKVNNDLSYSVMEPPTSQAPKHLWNEWMNEWKNSLRRMGAQVMRTNSWITQEPSCIWDHEFMVLPICSIKVISQQT